MDMADDYTLKEIVSEIRNDLKIVVERQSRLMQKVDDVVTQTTKTNGRVLNLEDQMDALEREHATVVGKMTVVASGISVVFGAIVSWFFNSQR